jgi:ABC-type nickel/cobalt efflux system permease component RcnA
MTRVIRAGVLASVLLALVPALAVAHPLGNFTINHFAAVRVGGGEVALDVVIDRAEIPAFQARQLLDTDADGAVSPAEQERARSAACPALAGDLALTADGVSLPLATTAAGISFPAGAGGLPTMRLVCEYSAAVTAPTAGHALAITFTDNSFSERIGWREIVFAGDLAGVSQRLTRYPQDLLAQPLDVRSADFSVAESGAPAPTWTAPDAQPLAGGAGGDLPAVDPPAVDPPLVDAPAAVVPGGIGAELAGIIDARDLSPAVVLASLLVAIALGAAHAVSPGHGKTIMAAYLVGTKGTARHAIALGMTVSVSHTLGVLVLALLTLAASTAIPPERLYPVLGVGSGVLVVAIGGWLLLGRLRELRAARRHAAAHAHGDDHAHDHTHGHAHSHEHGHAQAPEAGAALSWRGLFALGLSGGLLPSAAALILLLGSISAGRVAYGLLLVVGFGVGMALVLGGVGLSLVYAARLVERLPIRGQFLRSSGLLQMATACVVIALGVVLTGQALTQVL